MNKLLCGKYSVAYVLNMYTSDFDNYNFFMILQQVIPNITAESVLLAVVGVYSIAVQSLVSLLDIGAYYFLVYAAMVLLQ